MSATSHQNPEPERTDVDALLLDGAQDGPESYLSLDQIRLTLGDDHPLVRRLSLVAELDQLPGLYAALVREAHPGARAARVWRCGTTWKSS